MKSKINKKVFVSAFASVLAGAAIVVPNVNISNSNTQSTGLVSTVNKNALATADTCVAPKANDLYNDYAYNQGFVAVNPNNNSVINFYNWLGLRVWSYDVSANSTFLFGFNATVQTLKFRSSADGNQMYVYGTLTTNQSFVFILNAADGSVVNIGQKVSLVSDGTTNGLITGVNLLTFSNGYMILTPKNVSLYSNYVYVSFSEIDPSTFTITNRSYDISSTVSKQYVYAWGEIVSVQKLGSYFSFVVKYDVYKDSSKTSHRPSLLVACLDAQIGTGRVGSFLKSSSYSYLDYQNNAVDLDKVIIDIEKVIDTSSSQEIAFSMRYSTASSIAIKPTTQATVFGVCQITSSGSATITTYDTAQNTVAGILGYLKNPNTGDLYAVLSNSNLTQIAFLLISDALLHGKSIDDAFPWWVNINSFASANNQTVSLDFIPRNSGSNNNYYGYIETQQENSDGSKNAKKSIFVINTSNKSFSIASDANFAYAYSDDQLKNKYTTDNYPATVATKNAIVTDVTKILKNGNPYTAVNVVSDYILVDTTKNTVKGTITFAITNYWNSESSQITRSVNIQLNPIKDVNSLSNGLSNGLSNNSSSSSLTSSAKSTGSSSNVVVYIVVILAALIGIAGAMVVAKVLKNKRRQLK